MNINGREIHIEHAYRFGYHVTSVYYKQVTLIKFMQCTQHQGFFNREAKWTFAFKKKAFELDIER